MKKIFYWSPITSQIATKKAVINSANSLLRYSSNYDVTIINVTGEFNKSDFSSENIRIYNLNNKLLKKKFIGKGFFRTRLEMIYIFLNTLFPLIKLRVTIPFASPSIVIKSNISCLGKNFTLLFQAPS